jgi:hypothetical protein
MSSTSSCFPVVLAWGDRDARAIRIARGLAE